MSLITENSLDTTTTTNQSSLNSLRQSSIYLLALDFFLSQMFARPSVRPSVLGLFSLAACGLDEAYAIRALILSTGWMALMVSW